MKNLLTSITTQPILVVGDLMLDHYIWGDTSRISPEAPVPVVDVRTDSYRAGGAANVALNIRALGAPAELCGWVGQDEPGRILCELLDDQGIAFDRYFLTSEAPTILKARVMVRNQQLCRLDREALPALYSLRQGELAKIATQMEGKKALILSDYGKGVLTQSSAEALLANAHKKGLFVAHDPKPRRQFHLKGVDLLTPNKAESLQLADLTLWPGEAYPAELVCQKIWEHYEPKYLVITLGGEGMLLSHKGKILTQIPAYAREVADVSGAGDTVIATLTLALAAGASLQEAAHLANTAAGIVVGKVGTAVATPQEILSFEKIVHS